MSITCCNGCVPPKRTPTCHATCPEYVAQKAKHEAEMEESRKKQDLRRNLYEQQNDAARRAVNAKRRDKNGKRKVY